MEDQSTSAQQSGGMSKTLIGVVIVVIIALAAGAYEFTKTKSASNTMMPSSTTSQTVASPTAAMKQASAYKDGTYTAEGKYMSPGGEEQVGVQLTLKNGVIEDITFTPKATRPTSVKFQGQFASGYKPLVMGKNIDEVNLDEVSGSSLTPKGFNDAISHIKQQAKS